MVLTVPAINNSPEKVVCCPGFSYPDFDVLIRTAYCAHYPTQVTEWCDIFYLCKSDWLRSASIDRDHFGLVRADPEKVF